ncbi:LRR domain containing protein [Parasponia andersonii]|uniref:LRR domain containing protein n=1 Tax=Parasponia andersonii TaxID=3476 RepID=A0A2P5CST9_PARAD|nr:LRR domain containing protein [Parasponia andersonii]
MLDLSPNISYYDDGGLRWNSLSGRIGPSLVELQHLECLDLSYNDFIEIPKFIGAFTRLRYLNFSENPLVGNIPSELGNLTELRVLDLSNRLGAEYSSKTTKSFEWLSHLPYLTVFKLSYTNFTKAMDWFESFKTAPSLSKLELTFCLFPQSDALSLSHTNSSNSLKTLHVDFSTFESATISHLLNLSNNLVDLSLVNNFNIKGPIPNSFQNLKSLRYLYFYFNEFEGEVPKSMGSLCNLKDLVLFGNRISSTFNDIMESRSGCKNDSLEILNLGWNRLKGSFPEIKRFPVSLRQLNVGANKLRGPLPDISKMPSLRELDVSNNKLNGTLPESIGKLSNLKVLDVSTNSFTGVISEPHFEKLSKLRHLDLSSNSNLSFKMAFNWVPPFQLQELNLGSCGLGPQFPSWLQTQSSISYLDLSGSGIFTAIPNWFSNLTSKLYYLDLSLNFINSTLPNFPLEPNNSPYVDLSSNQFHGSIPPDPLFNATMLNLSNNNLTRFGPLFCTLFDGVTTILDLSNNLLFGSLPGCLFRLNNLEVLNLDNNKFSGVIPSSMASLYQIQTLQLRRNNLSGNLSFLKNCTRLRVLDVGENNLEGTIPTWIGKRLTHLVVLLLESNKFRGMIPSSLCHLQSIRILDISHNKISGVVPSCINNFTYMVEKPKEEDELYFPKSISVEYTFGHSISGSYDNKALVRWKGKDYEYQKILGLLRVIDLSSNRLIGGIPSELANLVELAQLNLSRNNLSGAIPHEIGNLSKLESLDLSHNHLSGDLPMGLAKISSLNYLDLSYNHFSGRIPTSTQLQSLNASSYVGNLGLCGLPLSSICPGDGTSQEPDPNSIDPNSIAFTFSNHIKFLLKSYITSIAVGGDAEKLFLDKWQQGLLCVERNQKMSILDRTIRNYNRHDRKRDFFHPRKFIV